MATSYTYPLTSSIEATTLFSSEIIPAFTTDTDSSIYNIVSEYITIGSKENKNIKFISNSFDNIIFAKDDEEEGFELSTIYNFATGIESSNTSITFLKNVSFAPENAGKVTFLSPQQINFKRPFGDYDVTTIVTLEDYIKDTPWEFKECITFNNEKIKGEARFKSPENIFVDENDTTLNNYIINTPWEFSDIITFNNGLEVKGAGKARFNSPENIYVDENTTLNNYIINTSWQFNEDITFNNEEIKGNAVFNGIDSILIKQNDEDEPITLETYIDDKTLGNVKISENNQISSEHVGLKFNGKFYSFEDLHIISYDCVFKANDTEIKSENDVLTYTIPSETSELEISAENELIFDTAVVDRNTPSLISISSKTDSSINLSVNIKGRNTYAWLVVKTLNVETHSISTSVIFLRTKDTIKPPYRVIGDYEYSIKTADETSDWKKITNWNITTEPGVENIYVRNKALEVLNAYVLSSDGYTSLEGISGDVISLTVDDEKEANDWLIINCFDPTKVITLYRAIKIEKASPPNS